MPKPRSAMRSPFRSFTKAASRLYFFVSMWYNNHTEKGMEVCHMEKSSKVFNTDVSRLDFLYKKIAMSNGCLMSWMKVPEFADRMNALFDAKHDIGNAEVLEVCDELMNGKFKDEEERKKYYFQSLRRGVNHLRKVLEESETHD